MHMFVVHAQTLQEQKICTFMLFTLKGGIMEAAPPSEAPAEIPPNQTLYGIAHVAADRLFAH